MLKDIWKAVLKSVSMRPTIFINSSMVSLNTSFNIKGQPIVLTPDDAVDCFCSTEIDVLYIDGLVAWKQDGWGKRINSMVNGEGTTG